MCGSQGLSLQTRKGSSWYTHGRPRPFSGVLSVKTKPSLWPWSRLTRYIPRSIQRHSFRLPSDKHGPATPRLLGHLPCSAHKNTSASCSSCKTHGRTCTLGARPSPLPMAGSREPLSPAYELPMSCSGDDKPVL